MGMGEDGEGREGIDVHLEVKVWLLLVFFGPESECMFNVVELRGEGRGV